MIDYSKHFDTIPETKATELRPYNKGDIPILCEAAARFIPELPNYEGITVDKTRLDFLMKHNYGNTGSFQCWVIVDKDDVPVGAAAGYCVAGMITWQMIASDTWLFILPGWRCMKNFAKLMEAYRAWALARNAVIIQASQQGGYGTPEVWDKLMDKQGYKKTGSLYHLRMDQSYIEKQLTDLKGAS